MNLYKIQNIKLDIMHANMKSTDMYIKTYVRYIYLNNKKYKMFTICNYIQ